MAQFESSPKEDNKLANEMSFSDWEKSPGDTTHDEQKSIEGLKKGDITSPEELPGFLHSYPFTHGREKDGS